jgi:anthranilate synthase component 1
MNLSYDIAADLDTPVSAYLKLRPFCPRFLLESVEQGHRIARYSYIGFGDCTEFRLEGDGLFVDGRRRPRPADGTALLGALRGALAQAPRPRGRNGLPPLAGGLVGYASYDLARSLDPPPHAATSRQTAPDACYLAPRSLLVFDHLTRGVTVLHDGSDAEREALTREIVAALRGPLPPRRAAFHYEPARPSLGRGDFCDSVARVQSHIAAGDVYQLVLSVGFGGECDLEPFEVYRALRLLNPSPYMYYVEAGGLTVVGSSPEALVRLSSGRAMLRPIAGTLPRGADGAEDDAQARRLLADPKEGAEHVMLVDLARNDLGRVARAGSVRVEPWRQVERYSHVMHLVSGVEGDLAPGRDAFDLFAAAFPAGTLVGAPKSSAMRIIDELEPVGRGLYGGTVGYFGRGGDMDHAITIRSMVFGGGRYSYQAGAGIVADSRPEREHDEVIAKSAAMRRALEMARAGL